MVRTVRIRYRARCLTIRAIGNLRNNIQECVKRKGIRRTEPSSLNSSCRRFRLLTLLVPVGHDTFTKMSDKQKTTLATHMALITRINITLASRIEVALQKVVRIVDMNSSQVTAYIDEAITARTLGNT